MDSHHTQHYRHHSYDALNTKTDSLHSSRFSLGNRNRSAETLDVSIQVDVSAGVITYDSDDDDDGDGHPGDTPSRMSARGVRKGGAASGGDMGVARNKRGTPMYSREDIREQYCINDKSIHVLETSRRKPIFGCLTSGDTQASPCKKKSLLPACLRGRVPSDENIYIKSAHTSPSPSKGGKEGSKEDIIDYEDESYFKRRPKTICYTDPKRLASLDDNLAQGGRASRPRSDVAPYDHPDETDPAHRPTQLNISSGGYHSAEILSEDSNNKESYTVKRTAYTQPNTPDLSRYRQTAVTPDAYLDDRPQKHVSFQKAMSRSATVGGLEDPGPTPQETNGARRDTGGSGSSRSQERLLDAPRSPDYMEQRALDQLLAPVLTKALLQEDKTGARQKVSQRSRGQQAEGEVGSTLSLKRKKAVKKTIGIQTREEEEREERERRRRERGVGEGREKVDRGVGEGREKVDRGVGASTERDRGEERRRRVTKDAEAGKGMERVEGEGRGALRKRTDVGTDTEGQGSDRGARKKDRGTEKGEGEKGRKQSGVRKGRDKSGGGKSEGGDGEGEMEGRMGADGGRERLEGEGGWVVEDKQNTGESKATKRQKKPKKKEVPEPEKLTKDGVTFCEQLIQPGLVPDQPQKTYDKHKDKSNRSVQSDSERERHQSGDSLKSSLRKTKGQANDKEVTSPKPARKEVGVQEGPSGSLGKSKPSQRRDRSKSRDRDKDEASGSIKKSASSVSKVSMAMQTEPPFVYDASTIFPTQDLMFFPPDDDKELDTSTDYHEEDDGTMGEGTMDTSMEWQTDLSSFAWHTDDAGSSTRLADISFPPDSLTDLEDQRNFYLMNTNIDLMKDRRHRHSPPRLVMENVPWDGGGGGRGKLKDTKEEGTGTGARRKERKPQNRDLNREQPRHTKAEHIVNRPTTTTKHKDQIQDTRGNPKTDRIIDLSDIRRDDAPDRRSQWSTTSGDSDAMARRLRFRRQMAEDLLHNVPQDNLRLPRPLQPLPSPHHPLSPTHPPSQPSTFTFETTTLPSHTQRCPLRVQPNKARLSRSLSPKPSGIHSSSTSITLHLRKPNTDTFKTSNPELASTFPRRSDHESRFKTSASNVPTMHHSQAALHEAYTGGTWPRGSTDTDKRSDDIDLRKFDAIREHVGYGRTRPVAGNGTKQQQHKRSHLDINLVYKTVPVTTQGSNTNLQSFRPDLPRRNEGRNEKPATEHPAIIIPRLPIGNEENRSRINEDKKVKISLKSLGKEWKSKKQPTAEISDEYPRSDNDYKLSTSLSRKPSTRSEKSYQRRRKTSQKDLTESNPTKPGKDKDSTSIKGEKVRLRPAVPLDTTDTSSTMTNTDSVGRRMRKVKKKTTTGVGMQTEQGNEAIPERREDNDTMLGGRETSEHLDRKVSASGSSGREAKESDSSSLALNAQQLKKSIKKLGTCIQAASYEDLTERIKDSVSFSDLTEKIKGSVSFLPSIGDDSKTRSSRKVQDAPDNQRRRSRSRSKNRLPDDEPKADTVSVNTNASSLRRMKKVRKTAATTQTDDLPSTDPHRPSEVPLDAISIRTSSLRRIRRVEKRTIGIQTDEVVKIYVHNLNATLDELTRGRGLEGQRLKPHVGTQIGLYENIPAALREVGSSGNDADVSEGETEEELRQKRERERRAMGDSGREDRNLVTERDIEEELRQKVRDRRAMIEGGREERKMVTCVAVSGRELAERLMREKEQREIEDQKMGWREEEKMEREEERTEGAEGRTNLRHDNLNISQLDMQYEVEKQIEITSESEGVTGEDEGAIGYTSEGEQVLYQDHGTEGDHFNEEGDSRPIMLAPDGESDHYGFSMNPGAFQIPRGDLEGESDHDVSHLGEPDGESDGEHDLTAQTESDIEVLAQGSEYEEGEELLEESVEYDHESDRHYMFYGIGEHVTVLKRDENEEYEEYMGRIESERYALEYNRGESDDENAEIIESEEQEPQYEVGRESEWILGRESDDEDENEAKPKVNMRDASCDTADLTPSPSPSQNSDSDDGEAVGNIYVVHYHEEGEKESEDESWTKRMRGNEGEETDEFERTEDECIEISENVDESEITGYGSEDTGDDEKNIESEVRGETEGEERNEENEETEQNEGAKKVERKQIGERKRDEQDRKSETTKKDQETETPWKSEGEKSKKKLEKGSKVAKERENNEKENVASRLPTEGTENVRGGTKKNTNLGIKWGDRDMGNEMRFNVDRSGREGGEWERGRGGRGRRMVPLASEEDLSEERDEEERREVRNPYDDLFLWELNEELQTVEEVDEEEEESNGRSREGSKDEEENKDVEFIAKEDEEERDKCEERETDKERVTTKNESTELDDKGDEKTDDQYKKQREDKDKDEGEKDDGGEERERDEEKVKESEDKKYQESKNFVNPEENMHTKDQLGARQPQNFPECFDLPSLRSDMNDTFGGKTDDTKLNDDDVFGAKFKDTRLEDDEDVFGANFKDTRVDDDDIFGAKFKDTGLDDAEGVFGGKSNDTKLRDDNVFGGKFKDARLDDDDDDIMTYSSEEWTGVSTIGTEDTYGEREAEDWEDMRKWDLGSTFSEDDEEVLVFTYRKAGRREGREEERGNEEEETNQEGDNKEETRTENKKDEEEKVEEGRRNEMEDGRREEEEGRKETKKKRRRKPRKKKEEGREEDVGRQKEKEEWKEKKQEEEGKEKKEEEEGKEKGVEKEGKTEEEGSGIRKKKKRPRSRKPKTKPDERKETEGDREKEEVEREKEEKEGEKENIGERKPQQESREVKKEQKIRKLWVEEMEKGSLREWDEQEEEEGEKEEGEERRTDHITENRTQEENRIRKHGREEEERREKEREEEEESMTDFMTETETATEDETSYMEDSSRMEEEEEEPEVYERGWEEELGGERLKRSCMRTQATQTDVGQVRKSLPLLPWESTSPHGKAEMISQGAQTNGEGGRRRLVKSLSEVARYEGLQYAIYDLDDLNDPILPRTTQGPPPCPLRFSAYDIPLDEGPPPPPPLKFRQDYDKLSMNESPCSKPRRGLLQKTLSEGEILSERRRALSLASGYLEVDINGYSDTEEDVIEPQLVDEVARDLSRSKIFTPDSFIEEEEEFHENMLHKAILPDRGERRLSHDIILAPRERKFSHDLLQDSVERRISQEILSSMTERRHSHDLLKTAAERRFSYDYLDSRDRQVSPDIIQDTGERRMSHESTDSELKTFDPSEFRTEEQLLAQLEALSLDSMGDVPPPLPEVNLAVEGISGGRGVSPTLYLGTPSSEVPVGCEFGEHLEESVSESQVTVVARALAASQGFHSDSENGSFHLTDPSSAATTPSTRHKSLATAGSFDEDDLEDDLLPRMRVSTLVQSTTTLSSIEDEPTDVSENAITYSTTSSEVDRAIACSTDNDYSSIHSGGSVHTVKSEVLEEREEEAEIEFEGEVVIEENMMATLVKQMKGGDMVTTPSKSIDGRRLGSPESDSSSSLFTEQETSRSPASGTTNTMTSKSDLSRTDSHPTDQSETSEDYVTATENSTNYDTDIRRSYYCEERHVSSPPTMADIYEDETLTPKIQSPETSEVAAGYSAEHQELSDITEGASVASDFETAQDLTSPDGDTTTTSASYYIDHSIAEESDAALDSKKPEVPPKPAFLPRPDLPPKPDVLPKHERREEAVVRRRGGSEDTRTGAIKKRYSAGKIPKDDNRRYSRYFEDNDKGEFVESPGDDDDDDDVEIEGDGDLHGDSQAWSEEEREKAKTALKLDFPPGVSMFGEVPGWPDQEQPGDAERKTHKTKKPKAEPGSTETQDGRPMKAAKYDKSKRKSDEIATTPGMVRSPAMHEGFRLEDWTPVRTPGTPERTLDLLDSSDESYSETPRHPPKGRSPGRRTRESPGRKAGSPGRIAGSPVRQIGERQSPGRVPGKRESPQRALVRESPEQQPPLQPLRHSPQSIVPQQAGVPRESAPTKVPTETGEASEERLRPAGPVTGYLRAGSSSPTSRGRPLQLPESKLLAIAPLKDARRSAESLRSMSPGSDNVFLGGSREELSDERAGLCAQCGERPASREGLLRPVQQQTSVERCLSDRDPTRNRPQGNYRAKSEERHLSRDWGTTAISLEQGDHPRHDIDDDEKGVYLDPYHAAPWLYVTPSDEAKVWRRDEGSPSPIPDHVRIPGFDNRPDFLKRQDDEEEGHPRENGEEEEEKEEKMEEEDLKKRTDSTGSEKDFRRRYQAITHRMVHRKASVEMYRRLVHATFQSDKTVTVSRESGEFGFRIHGSRPVVVSAIETRTPAEESGLEVGDIIISINNINVLESSHSEVVRLAHAGCDTLHLEVARTCDVLTPLVAQDPTPICAGYLYKLSTAQHTTAQPHTPGTPALIRKWRRRWFALKRDHCLYYYKSEMEQHPLGAIQVTGHTIHPLAEELDPLGEGSHFPFTLGRGGVATLTLAAHSSMSRHRWGQVLTQAAVHAAQRDDVVEQCGRRVQHGPGAISEPDCFGYLHKLGSRWHQWNRRYCVLKDASLYLYHGTDAAQAIGVVQLQGYRVQSTSIGGKKHAFEILPPEPRFRHFYFYTESDSDKKRWLAALEYSIDRWIKVV